jgi:hypothetical protein
MRPFALFGACLLLAAATVGRSEPIAGQKDPRFESALALWLDDDEETALPQLAGLAAEGNRAAQVLVALIDRVPDYQGPWLVGRERAERLALMRAPGGLSGHSWMREAAADTPLAQLWMQSDAPGMTVATALAFAEIGEARAAREAMQALAARQYRGFAAVADDPSYPPDLRYLVWREWAATPEGKARAAAEIAALPAGDPQVNRYRTRQVAPADADAWLASAPLAAPLRATCAHLCPAGPTACLRAAYRLVKGHVLLAEFGTPSETLIPPEVWHASPRGRMALLRLPSARFRFGYEMSVVVRTNDACLADALASEVARFFE